MLARPHWRRWFFDSPEAPAHPGARAATAALLLLFFSALSFFLFQNSATNWSSVWGYREAFLKGWLLTVGLAAVAMLCSTLLGLLTALARRSSLLFLRQSALLYIEIVRGSPFLVLILIGYYVVFAAIGLNERLLAGVLLLSIFSGAYMAEIFRAGIESIGKSQLESARAIGLSRGQIYRFVILPQALRQTLPPLAGQFASLIKDSSLLSIIGISEVTFSAQQISSATFSTLAGLLPLAPAYLILTVPISLYSRWLESRSHFDT